MNVPLGISFKDVQGLFQLSEASFAEIHRLTPERDVLTRSDINAVLHEFRVELCVHGDRRVLPGRPNLHTQEECDLALVGGVMDS